MTLISRSERISTLLAATWCLVLISCLGSCTNIREGVDDFLFVLCFIFNVTRTIRLGFSLGAKMWKCDRHDMPVATPQRHPTIFSGPILGLLMWWPRCVVSLCPFDPRCRMKILIFCMIHARRKQIHPSCTAVGMVKFVCERNTDITT